MLEGGTPVYKIFALNNILCKSNSDARRLIQQGGAKLNGKILDYNYLVTRADIQKNNLILISAGTKTCFNPSHLEISSFLSFEFSD